MDRKLFLQQGMTALGASFILPLVGGCNKTADAAATSTSGSSGSTSTATSGGACTLAPVETAGPFQTITPSSLVSSNIVSDRTGVPFTIKITINNKNNSCAALAGAIVDIWHCDAAGNYSEYGGTSMQSTNYTSVHFLRGRQVTDAGGLVTFTSVFPGWYSGRAPHIHVHVYSAGGTSLMITQIAFPTDVCDTVYTTATNFYKKGKQDTTNASDNVFSDSLASELASVSGSVSGGYTLTHLITVAA
jgi:protocatechuate 3,4-dioxygenase beta subunit